MIVADTNLIVDLFIEDPANRLADAVFARDPMWAAPVLWRSEFRNTLSRIVRRRLLPLEDAIVMANEAERLLAGREHTVTAHRVFRLAAVSGCSAYDCEFVTLAEDLGVSLVTSDSQVVRAFPALALTPERFLAA